MSSKSISAVRTLKKRIFLVEDHPILREGFAQLLERQPDFQVCGQADDPFNAFDQISTLQPDLVVVDVELKRSNGIELMKRIRTFSPEVRILALSMHDELLYAERSLRAGARGYIMKQAPVEEILSAMRLVLRGERYLSTRMQERMLRIFSEADQPNGSNLDRLSDRELEVFRLIGNGLRTRQIAGQLGLSIKTVETYRSHIIQKLNLKDGMELVHYAINANVES